MNEIPIKDIQDAMKGEPTFIIDSLPIYLNPAHKNISIDVSGGADSALTVFLILRELNRRNQDCVVHIITHHRCWKSKPWQGFISKEVYDHLYKLRGNVKMMRHTNFIPEGLESKAVAGDDRTGECICVDEYRDKLIYDLDIDMGYNCTTLNPSIIMEGHVPSRNLDVVRKINLIDTNERMSNLLMYTNKSWVIKQYKDNNILDLLYVTRSCEGYIHTRNPSEWDGIRPEDCGECFWCIERHWAMDENEVSYE